MNTLPFSASHGLCPVESVSNSGRATNTKNDWSQSLRIQRTKPSSAADGGVAQGDAAFTSFVCAGETGRAHFRISSCCARVTCWLSKAARVAGYIFA